MCYRISPDYSTLEFTIGPNQDARHRVKDLGAAVLDYRRVIRIHLGTGEILAGDQQPTDAKRIPTRPFVGKLISRSEMPAFRPSLDPVRIEGKYAAIFEISK